MIRTVFWICLGGVTVSTAALILIVSVMGGFGRSIIKRHLSPRPHLIQKFEKNPFSSRPLLKESLPLRLRSGMEEPVFYEMQDVIVRTQAGFSGAVLRGEAPSEWSARLASAETAQPDKAPLKESSGASASGGGFAGEKTKSPGDSLPEVLTGRDLSLSLDIAAGDEVLLLPSLALLLPPGAGAPVRRVKIAGVLPPEADSSIQSGFTLFYRRGALNFGLFSTPEYGAEIRLKDPYEADLYRPYLQGATTWKEQSSSLFFALKLEKFIMTLFIALAFIISCLGVSSALFLLIAQKGRDIGIFQALGMSKKELCRVFTLLGFYLSCCGVFAGVAAGVGGAAFFKYTDWNFLPSQYQDRNIPAVFEPEMYVVIAALALLLSYAACFFPARVLSDMDPAPLLKTAGR